jgi:phosphonatase-like hydrolase
VSTAARLVVFDTVGTTVQADDAVPRAFAEALAAEGVSVDAAGLAAVRGATKRQAFRALLPPGPDLEARVGRAYQRFQSAVTEAYAPGRVQAVPGAAALLADLRRRDVRVALTTGFDAALMDHLLGAIGWRGLADTVVTGDDVPLGRPAPFLIYRVMERTGTVDAATVAVVGDTSLDLEAGHHARVRWNIGVWSGAHDRARLAAAPHTHLCASVLDVPAILDLA